MRASRFKLLIVTLWVGSLWSIGYIAAPTLFATLSVRVLAGTIAGSLFRIEAWLSIGCAVVLLVTAKASTGETVDKSWLRLVWVMLACALIGHFALHPFMTAIREAAGPDGVMNSASRTQFGILHGVSSAIYLIQSLLGAALVVKSK